MARRKRPDTSLDHHNHPFPPKELVSFSFTRQVSWLVNHLRPITFPVHPVALFHRRIFTYSSGGCSGFSPLSLFIRGYPEHL